MNRLLEQIKTDLEANVSKKDVQYYLIGMPVSISKQTLDAGVVVVEPRSTSVSSVTTGVREQETHIVDIVLLKNVQDRSEFDNQRESGKAYVTRVMDARNANGSLKVGSIREVVRRNMRTWGIMQGDLEIQYSESDNENIPLGTVIATITLPQVDIVTQNIN